MKRRDFLELAALGGAAPLLPSTQGGWTRAKAGAHRLPEPIAEPGELDELPVAALQEAMAAGRYTARRITELYLARIAAVDRVPGGVNAVIELNPDALAIADAMDRERAAGRVRGPLHGIPVMVKDNIDTGDRMMTTAGSLALVGSRAPRDATIVARLRDAGAVLLGKTNLSEWANYRSSRSSSGWSGRGRQTRNPWALDRNPCGSSSGSGAAVSASLCAITVGTETDGSIVCPASANGVVGLKPTVGLWSRSGIIPISATQDTAGPMGRTVADVAALLGPLVEEDPADPRTTERPGQVPDYLSALDRDGLRGRRIGVLRSEFGFHEAVDAIMEQAIETMRAGGAVIVDPVEIAAPRGIGGWERTVLSYEFKDGLNRYLEGLGANAPVRTLAEVIAFNEANAERSMPYFGQETLIRAEARGSLDEPEYRDAVRQLLDGARRQGIDATLAEHRLDAIMAPTGGPAWVTDLVNGDHFGGGSSSEAARAGYPSISIPAGYVHGLPVGMSLTSTAWREADLLAMAYAFEQASRVRRAPGLLPTLDLP